MVPRDKDSAQGKRRQLSCKACRVRKIKCNRNQVCSNCSSSGIKCEWRDGCPPRTQLEVSLEEARAEVAQLNQIVNSLRQRLDSLDYAPAPQPIATSPYYPNVEGNLVTSAPPSNMYTYAPEPENLFYASSESSATDAQPFYPSFGAFLPSKSYPSLMPELEPRSPASSSSSFGSSHSSETEEPSWSSCTSGRFMTDRGAAGDTGVNFNYWGPPPMEKYSSEGYQWSNVGWSQSAFN